MLFAHFNFFKLCVVCTVLVQKGLSHTDNYWKLYLYCISNYYCCLQA